MARTEVASGGTGSVLERPGRGQGAGTAPGAVGPDPPREHPGVRGPGPPPPGAERRPQLPAPLRTPALLPPPYGNLQPLKVTRRRFLGLSARPPPPGQRSCRGDSGRGSGFLGQNLLGRMGRARGEGEPGSHCPDFFFIKKNLPASFPPPSPGKLRGGGGGARAGGRSPARCGPKVEANPLPGPVFLGCPGERRVPQQCGAKFSPGSPARQERSGTRSHSRGLGVRPGLSSARDLVAEAWGPGPLQSPDPARLTFPRAETRGSGRATHRVAHAFPAGSPEDPRCPLRRSRRRRRRSPPPPAAAAAQITTRRV